MADYPDNIKSFTNPSSTDKMNVVPHATQHSDANDEINAIETELGTNPKGSYADVKTRLDTVDTSISTLNTSVNTNESDIATLQVSVSEVDLSSVSTLQASVATNEASIVILNASVNTNESDISTLQTSVATNESDITTLQTSVNTNESDITTLQTSVNNFSEVVDDATPQLGGNLDVNGNTLTGYTASRAIETDGSGNIQVSAVTSTELGYLDGVTSSIQDQLDQQPESIGIACSDETSDLEVATGVATFRMPFAMTLTEVRANVNTAPVGSTIIVDINESGTTILSTKLTIDASEKTSKTAATAPVISDSSLADDAEITIDIDQIGSSTAGKGLKVWLIGTRT